MATVLAKILDGEVALDGLGVTFKSDGNKVTFWGVLTFMCYIVISFFRALFGIIVQSETRSIGYSNKQYAQTLYWQQRQRI